MAQHDYVIANQGFPAFRSDLNDALAAIVSNNSGATEPTTMFAHQMWVDTAADPSVLKIRNADNDAWITIGTINQTGDTFTLTSAVSATTLNTSGAVVFNDAGADVDFRVESDTVDHALFVDGASGNVGIGNSSPSSYEAGGDNLVIGTTGNNGLTIVSGTTSAGTIWFADGTGTDAYRGGIQYAHNGDSMRFNTAGDTERARITSGGDLLVGKTSAGSAGDIGCELGSVGYGIFSRSASTPLFVNRMTDDGVLVSLRQNDAEEGTISVSGNTVSYNPFLGSHSGALADWSRTDIKIGTVMDTINELLEYKVVVIDVREDVPAKDAVLNEEGNEVEPAQEATTQTVQKRISYNGNGAVGSTATVEYEGQEYIGTIQHEREEPFEFNKHLKVKINDTAASKTVFGVFVGWNNDPNNDGGVYNDMLVGAVGNYVIRMAAGQTPEAGDLVEADGNGCAVVQDDDIIRTKTIAKVTSTIPQVTYDDGSFLVTCVLYCG